MITFTAGNSLVARASASKPFSPGKAMSMSTTFGKCFLVNSRASYPSPASATTSIPDIFSNSERMPARIRAWSSASSTRVVFTALAPERPAGTAPERRHELLCRGRARTCSPTPRPTASPARAFQAAPSWRPAGPSPRQSLSRRPAPTGAGPPASDPVRRSPFGRAHGARRLSAPLEPPGNRPSQWPHRPAPGLGLRKTRREGRRAAPAGRGTSATPAPAPSHPKAADEAPARVGALAAGAVRGSQCYRPAAVRWRCAPPGFVRLASRSSPPSALGPTGREVLSPDAVVRFPGSGRDDAKARAVVRSPAATLPQLAYAPRPERWYRPPTRAPLECPTRALGARTSRARQPDGPRPSGDSRPKQ